MLKWLSGLADRIFAVAFAFLFSQAPLFMQQYKQQLYGHVSELQTQVETMRRHARLSGKSLESYIQKFLQSTDPDFSSQGELMQAMTVRYESLLKAFHELSVASPFAKPFVFLKNFRLDIARHTFDHYEFGILFSLEGLLYALFGIGAGYFVYAMISRLVIYSLPKRSKPA